MNAKTALIGLGLLALCGAAEAGHYCDYMSYTAKSRRELLVTPKLFATQEQKDDFSYSLGMDWSVRDYLKGNTLLEKSRQECVRYNLQTEIDKLFRLGVETGLLYALEVKQMALADLERETEARRDSLKEDVDAGNESLLRLLVAEEFLKELHGFSSANEVKMDVLKKKGAPVTLFISQLSEDYRQADLALQETDSRLRRYDSWNASLRGGFSHDGTDGEPFVAATLSYSLGSGNMHRYENMALKAYGKHVDESEIHTENRLKSLTGTLTLLRKTLHSRFSELKTEQEKVLNRLEQLELLNNPRTKDMADKFWVKSRRNQIELTYLEAHIDSLNSLLN